MRGSTHLIIFGLFLIFIPASVSAGITIFEPFHIPHEPEAGSEFTLMAVVKDTEGVGPAEVKVFFENNSFVMTPAVPDPTAERWTEGVLHTSTVILEDGGLHYFEITCSSLNGSMSTSGPLNLTVKAREDNEEDKIFGMPRSYCSISVIFITLMIIFLTYSYFKGRKMQKGLEAVSGASKVACSDCGKPIDPSDAKCPHCGAVFEEEEHLCGKCGKIISRDDSKCPHCGTSLKTFIPTSQASGKKMDLDLEKLKSRKIEMKGKVKCGKCGSIYLEKEGKCPECGTSK